MTNLQHAINQLIELLENHTSLPPELTVDAMILSNRLASGQLHLTVLGQFKRGKSTLINALLGAEILPSGILPVTLVPVFLRFGLEPTLEIHYRSGISEHRSIDELDNFVNETNNPGNIKEVIQVDLTYPTMLLQSGVVLIDTPGVGSTLQHNTDVAVDFLPRCDAGIVVLSADPPITASEVAFLRQVQSNIGYFFFVLNKVDYLDAQGITEAVRFLSETLQTELQLTQPRVVAVSARRGLQARLQGDDRAWIESGMAELEEELASFAVSGKQAALTEAIHRKLTNLVSRADQLLALEQKAIQLPREELEKKLETFKTYARAARQQRQEIMDRLGGDTSRLEHEIEAEMSKLRETAKAEVLRQAESAGLPTGDDQQILFFNKAVREFFDREREKAGQRFRRALNEILVKQAESAVEIRENLRCEAANLLDVAHFPLLAEEVIIQLSEPFWSIEHLPTRVTPSFGDTWLPTWVRQTRHARQQEQLVQELTICNIEKIRWWILRTINESIRSFQQSIMREIDATIQQIEQVLRAGYAQRQSQIKLQQEAIARLDTTRQRLNQIRQEVIQVTEQFS